MMTVIITLITVMAIIVLINDNDSISKDINGTKKNDFCHLFSGYPPTPTTPGSSKSVYESSPLTESLTAVMSPASATTAMMSPKMWPRQENVRMNGTMFNSCRPQVRWTAHHLI